MTRFTDLVGCRLPIQQAGMSRVTTPSLVAAVANAGGLGMLAVGRPTRAAVASEIDAVLALTDRPVGATFIVRFLDPAVVEVVAARLPIVEFFWGWPEPAVLPDGVITGWQVGSVDEAKAAADAGCAYLIAQGIEAGGHVRGTTPWRDLLVRVLAATSIPVLASGGIGTAADVREALALGADGVRVGTRFVAAVESAAHQFYVDSLIASGPDDTVLTETFSVGWPDAPHRVLARAVAAATAAGPDPVATMTMPDGSSLAIPRLSTTPPTVATVGELEAMALYAGMGVGAVTCRATAAAIVAELAGVPDTR